MTERLLDVAAFVGVEGEELGDEVEGERVLGGDDALPACGGDAAKLTEEVLPCGVRANVAYVLLRGCPDDLNNLVQLVVERRPREQRASVVQLTHYAPCRPHIDLLVVLLPLHDQLRGAVPPVCDIVGTALSLIVLLGKVEVADFHIVLGVQQNITGVQISVERRGF